MVALGNMAGAGQGGRTQGDGPKATPITHFDKQPTHPLADSPDLVRDEGIAVLAPSLVYHSSPVRDTALGTLLKYYLHRYGQ